MFVPLPQLVIDKPATHLTFRSFSKAWAGCERCVIGTTCLQKVQGRGQLPANFLLVGEAPGEAEDLLGRPFLGPAGKLLDRFLEENLSAVTPKACDFFKYFIINTVACRPTDSIGGNRKPTIAELMNCEGRLRTLAAMSQAKYLIFLGKTAATAQNLLYELQDGSVVRNPQFESNVLSLRHPAYWLRTGRHKSSFYQVDSEEFRNFIQWAAGVAFEDRTGLANIPF